ncbi:MAG: hypothetical protein OEV08_00875 [Nitrospira sp.]|nr:hypothetical protein [Nitrospira sp.]
MSDVIAASTETTAPVADSAPVNTGTVTETPQTTPSFDWKSLNLAPDLQTVVDRHQFKDPAMVVKSYGEFEKLHGVPVEQIIKLPNAKDASNPKAWDAIYNKLGRPETADKYQIPVPKGDDGTFATQIKPWLHEAGVTQAGATKLAEKWNGFIEARQNAVKAEMEARNTTQVKELQLSWGQEYEKNAQVVDKAADSFGMSQDQLNALKQVMGPKGAMEFLYNIGKKMGTEDTVVPGMGGPSVPSIGSMTADQAKQEIARLKGDRDFARILMGSDPRAKMEARRDLDHLHKIAYPGMSKADAIAR